MSTLEQAEAWIEAQAIARIATLKAESAALRELVTLQAEDEGLWFMAHSAPEAYLQQELRRLHTAIEHQPFDLAAHQKRMAREYVTERLTDKLLADLAGISGRVWATALLHALFEEET